MSFEKELSLFIDAFRDNKNSTTFLEDNAELINSLVKNLRCETSFKDLSESNEDLFYSLVESGALPVLVKAICESYHNYYELIDQQAELVTYIRKTNIIDIDSLNYATVSLGNVKLYLKELKKKPGSVLQQLYAERSKYKTRQEWIQEDQLSFFAAFEMNLVSKIEAKFKRHH
ncbi:hypothetical protein OCT63_20480 [Vibrio sp. RW]|uniref:hypothetical protein n=1 Tax=Vibrio sp. RW TaxID=2998833 RepID=UPI0022CD3D71|nr:hypothetical protein [Vibrio sp. RW]MDA0146602.1 hypothetical protein [Vibrio sp. RW]